MGFWMAFKITKCLAKELTSSFYHLEPKLPEIMTFMYIYNRSALSEARPLSFRLKGGLVKY